MLTTTQQIEDRFNSRARYPWDVFLSEELRLQIGYLYLVFPTIMTDSPILFDIIPVEWGPLNEGGARLRLLRIPKQQSIYSSANYTACTHLISATFLRTIIREGKYMEQQTRVLTDCLHSA
jgi:hypothetical protein